MATGSLETIRAYLAKGGDELQVVVEWLAEHTTDPVARELAEAVLANLDPDA